jgi:DNA-binding response OmpR family regulator
VEHVLIVEDEYIVATELQDVLETAGYGVAGIIDTAVGAMRMVREEDPDLVLMDIRLAGKEDGIDAAVEIWDRFRKPVVFLTAYSDKKTITRVQESGSFAYLVKPVREAELISTIKNVLSRNLDFTEDHESAKFYLEVCESIADPLILLNASMKILWVNKSAEQLLQKSRKEIMYKRLEIFFQAETETTGKLTLPVMDVMINREAVKLNGLVNLTGQFKKQPCVYSLAPKYSSQGNIDGVLLQLILG